jgi:hypothetical protein
LILKSTVNGKVLKYKAKIKKFRINTRIYFDCIKCSINQYQLRNKNLLFLLFLLEKLYSNSDKKREVERYTVARRVRGLLGLFAYATLWMKLGFPVFQSFENEKKFKCREGGKKPGIENLEISKFSIPKGLSFLKFEVSLKCVRGFMGRWYPLFSFVKKEQMQGDPRSTAIY